MSVSTRSNRSGAERLDRAGVVARRRDVDLHAPERDGEQLADVGLVVDDQRARASVLRSVISPSQRRGSAKMMRKMLPPPGRGS